MYVYTNFTVMSIIIDIMSISCMPVYGLYNTFLTWGSVFIKNCQHCSVVFNNLYFSLSLLFSPCRSIYMPLCYILPL